MTTKTFSEMMQSRSFEDRFRYLSLRGRVGLETFGFERYLNQTFYRSVQWRQVRDEVIVRDQAHDLGCPDYEISGRIIIHHMNPMRPEDIIDANEQILNPEYLISVSHRTHNAIHYGDPSQLPRLPLTRTPGDTDLWSRTK